jgi:hypothetical protein
MVARQTGKNIPKDHKILKRPLNIPKVNKIYQRTQEQTKNLPLFDLQKYIKNGIFGMKIFHLATLVLTNFLILVLVL